MVAKESFKKQLTANKKVFVLIQLCDFSVLPGVDNGLPRWMLEVAATVMKFKPNQTKENTDSLLFQYTNWTNPDDPFSNRRSMIDVISDLIFKAPTIKTVQAYADKNSDTATYLYQVNSQRRKKSITGSSCRFSPI